MLSFCHFLYQKASIVFQRLVEYFVLKDKVLGSKKRLFQRNMIGNYFNYYVKHQQSGYYDTLS